MKWLVFWSLSWILFQGNAQSLVRNYPIGWMGQPELFLPLDTMLQSNGAAKTETIGTFSKHLPIENWGVQLNVRCDFALSNTNYPRIYLAADTVFPFCQKALYLKWNSSNKNIQLRSLLGQTDILLAETEFNIVKSGKDCRVKVFYSNGKVKWYTDTSFNQAGWISQKEVKWLISSERFSGIVFSHTSTRAKSLWIREFRKIPIPFGVYNAVVESANTVRINFTEKCRQDIAISTSHNVQFHKWETDSTLLLKLALSLYNRAEIQIYLNDVVSYSGQIFRDSIKLQFLKRIGWHDVRIVEFMPSPNEDQIEFVEIFNTTQDTIWLDNSKFCDGVSCITLPAIKLAPHQYCVLNSQMGISLPALNNSGDKLFIWSGDQLCIDSLEYSNDWFGGGSITGYSFEINDPFSRCHSMFLWKLSAELGGSPGEVNIAKPDTSLSAMILIQEDTIQVVWDDYLNTANSLVKINDAIIQGKWLNEFNWIANQQISKSEIITLELDSTNFCHSIQKPVALVLTPTFRPVGRELRLTEILFNPMPYGFDYIEITNTSDQQVRVERLTIIGVNDTIELNFPITWKPNSSVVVCKDTQWLKLNYTMCGTTLYQGILPALPDESGKIELMDNSRSLDQIHYSEDQHNLLLADREGIALERFQLYGNEQWISAASGGSPGCWDGIHQLETSADWSLNTQIISPDGDGYDDVLMIQWKGEATLVKAYVTVYALAGNTAKVISKGDLIRRDEILRWEADSDVGLVTPGWYIIHTSAQTESGWSQRRWIVSVIR